MRDMTHVEAIAFLSEGTRTGKLATTSADGRPHVTPVWFVVDGDDLVFNTWHTSAKAKHLHVEDDLYYIRNYTPLLDLRILVHTLGAVIRGG